MTSDRQCAAIAKTGERCKAPPMTGEEFCFTHHPESQDRRAEARARGGRNSSRIARLEKSLSSNPTLHGVVEILAEVTESVREGTMSPAVGNSVASLSRALVAALESADSATRLRELETMIDRLLAGDGDGSGLRAVG